MWPFIQWIYIPIISWSFVAILVKYLEKKVSKWLKCTFTIISIRRKRKWGQLTDIYKNTQTDGRPAGTWSEKITWFFLSCVLNNYLNCLKSMQSLYLRLYCFVFIIWKEGTWWTLIIIHERYRHSESMWIGSWCQLYLHCRSQKKGTWITVIAG